MSCIPFNDIIPGFSVPVYSDAMVDAKILAMGMTGKDSNQSCEVLRRLKNEKFNKSKLLSMKLPGAGNKKTFVVHFKDAIQLIMVLPGDFAKETRAKFADIITRYFAGHHSLAAEVQANAQSSHPIAEMARESLAGGSGGKRSGEELGDLETAQVVKKMREDVSFVRAELSSAGGCVEMVKTMLDRVDAINAGIASAGEQMEKVKSLREDLDAIKSGLPAAREYLDFQNASLSVRAKQVDLKKKELANDRRHINAQRADERKHEEAKRKSEEAWREKQEARRAKERAAEEKERAAEEARREKQRAAEEARREKERAAEEARREKERAAEEKERAAEDARRAKERAAELAYIKAAALARVEAMEIERRAKEGPVSVPVYSYPDVACFIPDDHTTVKNFYENNPTYKAKGVNFLNKAFTRSENEFRTVFARAPMKVGENGRTVYMYPTNWLAEIFSMLLRENYGGLAQPSISAWRRTQDSN